MAQHHEDNTAARSDLFDQPTPPSVSPDSTNRKASHKSSRQVSEPLQVTTPADALAYIECTLGFKPSNSLIAVAFAGNKMSTVVRCDIPESLQHMARCDTPESVTFMDSGMTEPQELQFIDVGRNVGELMARDSSTTSALLIYIADDVTVSDQHALAVMGTANSVISAQFALQGVPVQESWLIHHSKLWHLRCTETAECIIQGENVEDPRTTSIYQALDPAGNIATQEAAQTRQLRFPPDSTVVAHKTQDTDDLLTNRPRMVLKWLSLWDAQLRQGPSMLHTDEVAQLLAAVEHAPIRDALLATACFDLSTAIRGMIGLRRFPAQLAAVAELYGNMSDGTTVRQGLEGESVRAPDWPRIAQLERLSHQLLPLSDQHSGGVLAGIIVWIDWVRGRGSVAFNSLRQARERFPTEQYLVVLEEFLCQGTVAGWATRTDSAWSSQHAA